MEKSKFEKNATMTNGRMYFIRGFLVDIVDSITERGPRVKYFLSLELMPPPPTLAHPPTPAVTSMESCGMVSSPQALVFFEGHRRVRIPPPHQIQRRGLTRLAAPPRV
jgi:hypothetical protein